MPPIYVSFSQICNGLLRKIEKSMTYEAKFLYLSIPEIEKYGILSAN
jgi:hypothetical protein